MVLCLQYMTSEKRVRHCNTTFLHEWPQTGTSVLLSFCSWTGLYGTRYQMARKTWIMRIYTSASGYIKDYPSARCNLETNANGSETKLPEQWRIQVNVPLTTLSSSSLSSFVYKAILHKYNHTNATSITSENGSECLPEHSAKIQIKCQLNHKLNISHYETLQMCQYFPVSGIMPT